MLTTTGRRWYATIGQFSLIRLERDTQLLIPAYDYSLPEKECPGSSEDDPCELFGRIRFPVEEFFPPDSMAESGLYSDFHNRMLKIGSASGHEPQVLSRIAEIYEEQAEDDMAKAVSLIEPVLVALLSIVIGAVLLSMILPMAGVMSSL